MRNQRSKRAFSFLGSFSTRVRVHACMHACMLACICACVLTVATVVSLVALALKSRIFVQHVRDRHSALTELDDAQSDRAKKLKKHQKRLNKTKKQIYLLYCS